jgi:hypothetical protein
MQQVDAPYLYGEESLDISFEKEKLTALALSYIKKMAYGKCHRDNTTPKGAKVKSPPQVGSRVSGSGKPSLMQGEWYQVTHLFEGSVRRYTPLEGMCKHTPR